MKHLFKTAAVLLFCGALLLSGCSGVNTTSMPMFTTDLVNIAVTNYMSFLTQNETAWYTDDEAKSAWCDYMLKHTNTDFTIYREGLDYLSTASEPREGLVLMDNMLQIQQLAREGTILPLDDYLADNANWQALPEEFRSAFKIDGKTYALPYSEDVVLNSGVQLRWEMAVNTVWLSQLGLEMPKTLDDLAMVGKAFAQNDMNGDGIPGNDYLLGQFYAMWNFHIMQAYGLYCDPYHIVSMGYDPELGSIVDPLYKNNAEPALTYLLQLYNDGAIDPDSSVYYNMERIDADIRNGKYGTVYIKNGGQLLQAGLGFAAENYERLTGKPYNPSNKEVLEWAAGVYELLPPLNTEYPVTYSGTQYGYVLTAATPRPKEVINRFVDLCYGFNSTSYLECNYGSDNSYVLESDGSCRVEGYVPSYGIAVGIPAQVAYPNLGGYYKNSLGDSFLPYSEKSGSGKEYGRVLAGLNQKITNYIDKYTSMNLMVEVPLYLRASGPIFEDSISTLVRRGSFEMMVSLSQGTYTVKELLEQYREDAVIYGLPDVLREANETLHLPNVQKFDVQTE